MPVRMVRRRQGRASGLFFCASLARREARLLSRTAWLSVSCRARLGGTAAAAAAVAAAASLADRNECTLAEMARSWLRAQRRGGGAAMETSSSCTGERRALSSALTPKRLRLRYIS